MIPSSNTLRHLRGSTPGCVEKRRKRQKKRRTKEKEKRMEREKRKKKEKEKAERDIESESLDTSAEVNSSEQKYVFTDLL